MEFESALRSHVGCRRTINEDSALSRADIGIWAVADGMGGHDAGEVASGLVIEMLASCERNLGLKARAAAARQAIGEANARLVGMGSTGPEPRTIGSTVVAIVADGDSFVCLWVGDSRAYLARDNTLVQLTKDHSLVQELVDIGEIDPSDAGSHPNANIITRAVGTSAKLRIDSNEGRIIAGDSFLLASDGLTRLVGNDEILESLQAADLDAAADRLIEVCLARGAPDNVSFVILKTRFE